MFNANDIILYCNQIVNFDIEVNLPKAIRAKQKTIIPNAEWSKHFTPIINKNKIDADLNLKIIQYAESFKNCKINKKFLEHIDNYSKPLTATNFHKIMTMLSGVEQLNLF